jgi:hypothetical protein
MQLNTKDIRDKSTTQNRDCLICLFIYKVDILQSGQN